LLFFVNLLNMIYSMRVMGRLFWGEGDVAVDKRTCYFQVSADYKAVVKMWQTCWRLDLLLYTLSYVRHCIRYM